MAFSQEVINQAWRRAGGKCECTLGACNHNGRCNKMLDPQNKIEDRKWHAHHIISQEAGGSDTVDNCRILCVPCHEKTRSYGV
jgi:5-methylcytosine-specific restriction endonuclease McrA